MFQDNMVSSSRVTMFPHQLLIDAYTITLVGLASHLPIPGKAQTTIPQ